MSMLEKAIAIALETHRGARDKAGAPYVLHPLRVMFRMDDEDARIAAVLHDVVEDSKATLEWLREQGFSEPVLEALDSVTRRKEEGESYEDFIDRAGLHPVGLRIKRSDILDNLDVTRLAELAQQDVDRLRKYHRALNRLADLESIQREIIAARYENAGSVELVPRAVPHTRHVRAFGSAGTIVVTGFKGAAGRALMPKEYLEIREVLESGEARRLYDVAPQFAPFYCPECDRCYTYDEWNVRGSGRRGKCPEGHGRPWED